MSIERVICYVDLSPSSQRGARLAGEIAKHHGAHVELVHAPLGKPLPTVEDTKGAMTYLPTATPMPFIGRTAEKLRQRIFRLRNMMRRSYHEDTLQTSELEEPSAKSLIHHAYKKDADLIVVAAEGAGMLESMLHSSMPEKVSRQAPCPVLTVTPESAVNSTMKHVLVGIDFSEQSMRALESACELVGHEGRITLLRVWPKPTLMSSIEARGSAVDQEPASPIDLACAGELRRLEELIQEMHRPEIRFEPWVCAGRVDEEIARVARDAEVDAVVLGSHRPQNMGERVFGTLSDRLIDELDRPVITVPRATKGSMMMSDKMPN